jgi:hypothetical protein
VELSAIENEEELDMNIRRAFALIPATIVLLAVNGLSVSGQAASSADQPASIAVSIAEPHRSYSSCVCRSSRAPEA